MKKIIFLLLIFISVKTHAQDADNILTQSVELYNQGKYQQAIDLLKNNEKYFDKDKNPNYYATFLNNTGLMYYSLQDYQKAEEYYLESTKIMDQTSGKNHPHYVLFSENIGLLYEQTGNYREAEKYYTKAHIRIKEISGEKHPDYVISLNKLGTIYSYQGDYKKAEETFLKAIKIGKTSLGEDHLEYMSIINNLGWMYYYMGNYSKSEIYMHESKEFIEKNIGKERPEYTTILNNLGQLYHDKGDYQKAEEFTLEALTIREKMLGKDHPDYAMTLNNAGAFYHATGAYKKSEIYLLEAENIWEKTIGNNHPNYAMVLNNLGNLYERMGNYSEAEKYLLEARSIRATILGENHPDYAITCTNLGNLYLVTGNYKKAEEYYLEAKNILENPENVHPNYALVINNLGMLYENMGNYRKAEEYHLEAKRIKAMLLGENHPDYLLSLNNLACFYLLTGDHKKAEEYFLKVKTGWENTLGKKHPNYTLVLNNLGRLYQQSGKYQKAEDYYLESKNVREESIGKEHPDYTITLINLGELYYKRGNIQKAEEYFLESKNNWEKNLGKAHPNYAVSLNNLGYLYNQKRDYEKAEAYFLESKSIKENFFGKDHSEYMAALINLGEMYSSMGNYQKAFSNKAEADKIITDQIQQNFTFLSEHQRNLFWDKHKYLFETSYSLTYRYPTHATISHSYNNTLFTKGLLLRSSKQIRDAVYSSGNPELTAKYDQLNDIHQQIRTLQSKDDLNTHVLKSLKLQADSLDKILTVTSSAYKDIKTDISMNWQNIQAVLNENEAAIEFVNFRYYTGKWTDSTLYCALVLKKSLKAPLWIPLFEYRELAQLIKKNNPIQQLYSGTGKDSLYQLIWKPLEKELRDIHTIYYSPSGILHQIAFTALENNKGMFIDQYDLKLVSSTREIIHLKKETDRINPQGSAVVYGGLWYDADKNTLTRAAKPYIVDQQYAYADIPSERQRGYHWEYLEGTEKEAKSICENFNNRKIRNLFYSGVEGNEESFKNLNGNAPDMIHLATHGFFLSDFKERDNHDLLQRIGGDKLNVFENPLLRSGLLMAGANRAWTGENMIDGIEDGILTADEISRMNLSKTKLVVLSACETGLGQISNSEGVFGLQRAFKLAGVESLIMSLWSVPDQATSELMSSFYEQWLSGKSKHDAFTTAQKQVREKYAAPYYWAGFVMLD